MLDAIRSDAVLFLDIETAPQYAAYEEVPENYQRLWEKKSSYFRKDSETASDVYHKAGIYAEFGKIICISTGMLGYRNHAQCFRMMSFTGDDEIKILNDFKALLEHVSKTRTFMLCAHNGKEFDFPYISRRMLVHGLEFPAVLEISGKKPWEVMHIDTMELWKFGDYKHYTSLELLAALFGIPSPKADIDGSMVAEVYYKFHDLARIVEYCQRDVFTVAQIFMRYKGAKLLSEDMIEIVNP